MADRKFNLGGKKIKDVRGSRVQRGNKQDLIKQRPVEREKLIPEIEKVLDTWDGGGMCIVFNHHDENENVTGAQVMVVGAEGVSGIMKLARAVHNASEQIIEDTVNNMKSEGIEGVMALMAAAVDLHSTKFEDDKED